MSDLAQLIFDQARIMNTAAAQHIALGRAAFARDVLSIIGTASIDKTLADVIAELIAKCGEEQGKSQVEHRAT